MATVKRSTILEILPLLRTKLSTDTGLGEHIIIPTVEDNPRPMGFVQQIFLKLEDPSPDRSWTDSVNRHAAVLVWPISVMVYTYFGTDPIHDQTHLLLDETNGHLALLNTVMDSLIGFFPEDGSGNHTTIQELHLLPSSRPHSALPDKGWARSVLRFSVVFKQALTQ